MLFLLFRHGDMAYYQHERGILPEERLESALQPLLGSFDGAMTLEFWNQMKGNFVPGFRDYIDRHLAPTENQ